MTNAFQATLTALTAAIVFALSLPTGAFAQSEASQAISASSALAASSAVDPTTQIEMQFQVLSAAPGAFEKASRLANGKDATADRLYAALIKVGASTALSPRITTASGSPASINMSAAIPYNGTEGGQPKVFTVTVGTTLAVTPRLLPNGSVQAAITFTKSDIADGAKPGVPPATNTQSLSASRTIRPGQTVLIGRLKPTAGFGQQQDEVVFARVLSIHHVPSDPAPSN